MFFNGDKKVKKIFKVYVINFINFNVFFLDRVFFFECDVNFLEREFFFGRSLVLDFGMLLWMNWYSFFYKKINNFCFKFNEDKVNVKV